MESAVDLALRPFPAPVAAELAVRRRAVLDRAHGRVLDLDHPADRSVLAAVVAAPDQSVDGPRYDSIVSTAALVAWPDLREVCAAFGRLLVDDGDLFLVEPVNHPGVAGLVAGSLGAVAPACRGRHLSRDVVATLRSVGFTLADVDRFRLATSVYPLRRWIDARAVIIPHVVAPPAVSTPPTSES